MTPQSLLLLLLVAPALFPAVLCRFSTLDHLKPKASEATQARAVTGLLRRLLGNRSTEFLLSVNRSLSNNSLDVCELSSARDGRIVASGSSGVALASGIYNYLKYFCNCQVSWSGKQLELPSPLPQLSGVLRISSPHRFRYYQNVCTVSYSSVWWDWSRWETEIDWMALNGINLPLAFTGQEALWEEVYRAMGLNETELEEFFSGPAFLAWNRMANMGRFGGPLPPSWHVDQLQLQFKILQRMRAFGMIPVLPAFSGNIPKGILRLFPKANVTRLGPWAHFNCSFSCSYILDPRDPLFLQIGALYLSQVVKTFGTDHIYNTDTFNEMTPPSSDTNYLSAVSRSVFASMTAVDPDAIWLMQGWLFYSDPSFWKPPQIQALLHGVPLGRMIVLDLFAEADPVFTYTQSFYGQPFIWCMLHNFGGNNGFFGTVESINSGPFQALSFPNSTLVGLGMTPEGIEQNPVIYELMSELAWRREPVNLTKWVSLYAARRYGSMDDKLTAAWRLLLGGVYNCTWLHYVNHNHSPLVRRPSLKMRTDLWYDPADLLEAWKLFMDAAPTFMSKETFQYDLVDLTRQVLQDLTSSFYQDIADAYANKKMAELLTAGGVLVYDLLPELDRLLSSNQNFLLGTWLERARSKALNEREARLYDMNARNQITLWGPSGEILDYANKQWGGLVEDYYAQRWALFVHTLVDCLDRAVPFKQDSFNQAVFQVEQGFISNGRNYSSKPQGDTFQIARRIFLKYHPQALKRLQRTGPGGPPRPRSQRRFSHSSDLQSSD
ncbi:alpha-N-acetylglucosaminidase [Cyprinodon tularosa]|uniref:alpha-N-acetylglucosaminidase n=1 Tax=Cyprinodon tularosa TaxID=77115 RepID=UPI0018E1E1D6|nr:alpha-N-acetylglucosaminidase [Cyprinodon tularosa]